MTTLEDKVVQAIHHKFDGLPKKCKPRPLSENGVAEWVPLSGIALCYDNEDIEVVALGTGMKCLPLSKVPAANGTILHDWHAEVLAMRAFNRMLLEECLQSQNANPVSRNLERRDRNFDGREERRAFTVRSGIRIFMYCSEAPCGDASMELVMQKQDDATPWPVSASSGPREGLLGRECFSELGMVRRKPARGDSPLTMSKSCSDKIAMKQCTSLLNGLAGQLMHPGNAYIDTLILPESQYNVQACERCFGANGRMGSLKDRAWPGGHAFRPFRIIATSKQFSFSQAVVSCRAPSLKGSNVSAVWTGKFCETMINGVLQGRKQGDPNGASQLSRTKMWESFREIVQRSADSKRSSQTEMSYVATKNSGVEGRARRQVKAGVIESCLQGWVTNAGDDFCSHSEVVDVDVRHGKYGS